MAGLWLGWQGFGRGQGENREKHPFFGRALVKIREKLVKNTLCGRALVRVRAKIENNTLFR